MSKFEFKKFTVHQDRCAMKVGTDGVLLGAWIPLEHDPYNILDIGSGTGLIALMLAQRCKADQIDALEIDADAYEQCVENFENSPWNDRLFCFHTSLDDFMEELQDETYDLIVSNPPFYAEEVSSGNDSRDRARQNQSLPFEDLCEAAGLLLTEHGLFAVVIPKKEEERFVQLAAENELYPSKITRVKGTPESEIKRSLLAFGRNTTIVPEINELTIETVRHQYTDAYKKLLEDFLLKL